MRVSRTLSYRYLVAISAIQVISALNGQPSLAGGPISNDSDILGIKLTMTRDQAKRVINDNFSGSAITELPVELGTPEFKKTAIAGFVTDVTPKQEIADSKSNTDEINKRFEAMKAAGLARNAGDRPFGAVGDHGRDVVMVLFNPNDNASDIFGVSRTRNFSNSSFPVAKVLVESLIEKYGPPSRSISNSYTWMNPAVSDHIQSLERARRPFDMHCSAMNGSDLFIYEDPNYYASNNLGSAFAAAINTVTAARPLPTFDISKCGTVLQVDLTLSQDQVYAIQMTARLLDLTRAQSELKSFAADVWRRADEAKQAKISKDSQNKPKL